MVNDIKVELSDKQVTARGGLKLMNDMLDNLRLKRIYEFIGSSGKKVQTEGMYQFKLLNALNKYLDRCRSIQSFSLFTL